MRDSGPTSVLDRAGQRAAAAFTFNAWGAKYHPYDQDAKVGARIAEYTGDTVYRSRLVAEGGGFCSDGHVDGYLALIKPGALLFEDVADPADPRFQLMAENRKVLETETDAKGRHFELVSIPEAPRRAVPADALPQRFCRSYVNFYLANGAVIAPAYGIGEDRAVFEILQRVYPDRQVVPVNVETLCRGGGGIHCITQQEPLGNGGG